MEQWQMEMSGWYPEFQALRHRLHREPERSFQEHGTTQLIRELLTGWGAEVEEHPGLETGLTALIRGAHPGPTIALREDIDALPMGENTGLPFSSCREGLCHACGHDIHTAALLWAAKALCRLRDRLHGSVKLIFQCAEEVGAGAEQMLALGALGPDRPEAVVGFHCDPKLPWDTVGLRYGPSNASFDILTWHITGPAPKTGQGGGTGGKPPHDSTASVPEGTFVQTTGLITSLLYDPSGDGNISETARRGAIAQVAACAETVRNGKTTWAYQLTSGDWVLAYNVQEVEGGTASFTGAQAVCSGRDELLQFSGSGTPLASTNQIENTLSLRFYGAEFAADFAVSGSSLVRRCEVKPFEGGTELVLHFDAPLWGHVISYEGNTVQVVLKAAPTRSTEPNKPLTGVKVLLDAGHGDTDTGAMGAGGQNAPLEKDANLAVAKAAQYRLEQLGATVEMIRTDDTFLSLEQRNAKITELRPDFFIAVHHNSVLLNNDANQSSGTECYYFYDSGKALAETLVAQVTAATRRPSRGAMWGYYYVTRNTLCPAVLLETGFMPNPAEFETVTDETSMWAAGDAIARSVLACVT